MSTPRLQCPHCGALFLAELKVASNALHCPVCRFDLLRSGESAWFVVRHRQKFGPFPWFQLKAWSEKNPFVAGDVLMCREAATQARVAKVAKAPGPAQTITDALGETLIPWSSASRNDNGVYPMDYTLHFEDFQLLRKLGSGGMGSVYLALQKSMGRKVALKLPAPAPGHAPDYFNRFLREAQMLSALRHPGIVGFLGAGQDKGVPFFAMEFIEGFSTAELMKLRETPLSVGDALHIVRKCAAALGYSHEKNIIHRDIKPQNIMISALGKVKIMDLGLAKPMQEDLSLTETGLTVGTPRFMAPEQARDAKHVDMRTDIYALGGVLYYFLAGRAPFEESTALNLLLAKERGIFPRPAPWRFCSSTTTSREIELPQKALGEKQIANNMTTLSNALEAVAFLNKLGRFGHAPTPDLIILGGDLEADGGLRFATRDSGETVPNKNPSYRARRFGSRAGDLGGA